MPLHWTTTHKLAVMVLVAISRTNCYCGWPIGQTVSPRNGTDQSSKVYRGNRLSSSSRRIWIQMNTKSSKCFMVISSDVFWGNIHILYHVCHNIHHNGVMMSAMASQIVGVSIVYPIVCSGAYQRKHQTLRHWPLWVEFTGDRCIPLTKGQWRGLCKWFRWA